jgi:HlyD family secretion protein
VTKASLKKKGKISAILKKEVLKFNPDAVELEHRSLPGGARWTLYTIFLFVLSLILWASIAKIDRIIIAHGKLITKSAAIIVQPLMTSTIHSIDIKIGEVVKAGQTLVTLDPTFSESDVTNLGKRKEGLHFMVRRLNSELSAIQLPKPEKNACKADKIEYQLYLKRNAHYTYRVNAFNSRIKQLEAKIETNRQYCQSHEEHVRIVSEIEAMYKKLANKQYTSRLKLLKVMEQKIQIESELFKLEKESSEIFYETESARFEKSAFIVGWQENTVSELAEKRLQMISVEEELRKAKHLKNLINLISPKDAVVLEIAKRSIGSVIKEAEPLITLVPIDVPLEVEAEILSKDIGRIRVGDKARIKLEAFPFQRHSTLDGRIRILSGDSFSKMEFTKEKLYFRTRIELINTQLKEVPEDFKLLPGMKVTCDINIGQRRIISYFLYPIIRALDESLREP